MLAHASAGVAVALEGPAARRIQVRGRDGLDIAFRSPGARGTALRSRLSARGPASGIGRRHRTARPAPATAARRWRRTCRSANRVAELRAHLDVVPGRVAADMPQTICDREHLGVGPRRRRRWTVPQRLRCRCGRHGCRGPWLQRFLGSSSEAEVGRPFLSTVERTSTCPRERRVEQAASVGRLSGRSSPIPLAFVVQGDGRSGSGWSAGGDGGVLDYRHRGVDAALAAGRAADVSCARRPRRDVEVTCRSLRWCGVQAHRRWDLRRLRHRPAGRGGGARGPVEARASGSNGIARRRCGAARWRLLRHDGQRHRPDRRVGSGRADPGVGRGGGAVGRRRHRRRRGAPAAWPVEAASAVPARPGHVRGDRSQRRAGWQHPCPAG